MSTEFYFKTLFRKGINRHRKNVNWFVIVNKNQRWKGNTKNTHRISQETELSWILISNFFFWSSWLWASDSKWQEINSGYSIWDSVSSCVKFLPLHVFRPLNFLPIERFTVKCEESWFCLRFASSGSMVQISRHFLDQVWVCKKLIKETTK